GLMRRVVVMMSYPVPMKQMYWKAMPEMTSFVGQRAMTHCSEVMEMTVSMVTKGMIDSKAAMVMTRFMVGKVMTI
ncbi:MAG: hypothetical protein JAY74_22055, partial [Candidatus Thiodiazotropha taylori]|nr:hypothetical protein [Candidatus Thiodiazotropha taylori]